LGLQWWFYGYDGHGNVRQLINANGNITDTYTYDAFGVLITSTGNTPNRYLYCGEQYVPGLSMYYNRDRYLEPGRGRFWTMDCFGGHNEDPASLHKYNYAHDNPVNLYDPSGKEAALVAVLACLSIAAVLLECSPLRNASDYLSPAGSFVPVDLSLVHGMYHSITISGSPLNADAMFNLMCLFSILKTWPVHANGNVTHIGQVVTFAFEFGSDGLSTFFALGQGAFSVEVTKFDPQQRTIVVRTLSGHPLAGWRLWRVVQVGSFIKIETFSVEHSATYPDELKQDLGGKEGMKATWNSFLGNLHQYSGGTVVDENWGTDIPHDEIAPYLAQVQ
jgi:RHS repeat-associated protein